MEILGERVSHMCERWGIRVFEIEVFLNTRPTAVTTGHRPGDAMHRDRALRRVHAFSLTEALQAVSAHRDLEDWRVARPGDVLVATYSTKGEHRSVHTVPAGHLDTFPKLEVSGARSRKATTEEAEALKHRGEAPPIEGALPTAAPLAHKVDAINADGASFEVETGTCDGCNGKELPLIVARAPKHQTLSLCAHCNPGLHLLHAPAEPPFTPTAGRQE